MRRFTIIVVPLALVCCAVLRQEEDERRARRERQRQHRGLGAAPRDRHVVEAGGGAFGGFKGTCSILGRCIKAIGADIAKWLANPTMDAMLGNA